MKIKSEPKVSRQNIEYHNICKVCPVPVKFSNKKQLSKHDKRKHNKCIDQINTENGTIYLSENEISSQHHSNSCEVCDEFFLMQTRSRRPSERHTWLHNFIQMSRML